MSRPEGSKPPDLYYDVDESRKYDSSSRMNNIQTEITKRVLEMLDLPKEQSCLILDVGCGSGLSGEVLTDEGHYWIGCDISKSMLEVAREKDCDGGDVLESDMGQGLPFRPGMFDGVVSISALQWLCYADTSEQDPKLRLNRFFSSLYSVLKRDAKAILQFYPENSEQAVLIATSASRVGFAGGIVIDYPNSSKSKKYYLCLSFERTYKVPKALGTHEGHQASIDLVARDSRYLLNCSKASSSLNLIFISSNRRKGKKTKQGIKSVEWIVQKKERRRKQDKEVKSDSKFTGRKRAGGF